MGFLLVTPFVSEYWKTKSYTYLFVFFNLMPKLNKTSFIAECRLFFERKEAQKR